MTWEQKLAAMNALGTVALHMRKPGDWYTTQSRVDVGDGYTLTSIMGSGATPEAAVEDRWRATTEIQAAQFIAINAGHADRKHVRWNGFMWEDVPREKAPC